MFGEWFGRAWDNSHEITSAMGSGNLLEMRFDESETLCVWDPKDAVISKDEFQIARASRVRWQWFYYGRPQRPENLHTIEYRVSGHSISVSDTTDWYEPEHNPDVTAPAVELVSFPVELLSPQG